MGMVYLTTWKVDLYGKLVGKLVGGFKFQPNWKICSSNWIISPNKDSDIQEQPALFQNLSESLDALVFLSVWMILDAFPRAVCWSSNVDSMAACHVISDDEDDKKEPY